jgi:hypothetical protein
LAASLLLAAATPCAALAEAPATEPLPGASLPATPEFTARKQAAAAIIRKLVDLSQAKLIFKEMRTTLREVSIPAMKESIQGNFPVSPQAGFEIYEQIARALTFFTYLDRASDEFETAMAANSDAMIEDAAGILARYHGDGQISDLEQLASLEATRKAFQTLYATSRLMTGFSLEDARAFAALNAWASQQLRPGASPFAMPLPKDRSASPSVEKMVKAQALVTGALRISRIEEMVQRLIGFVRDVYVPSAGLSPDERQKLLDRVQELELSYTMRKGIMLALAPVLIASYFNDEQIETLSAFVKTPAFSRLSSLYFDLIQTGTSFTPNDISDASGLLKRMKPEKSPETEKAWNDYYDRWSKIIYEGISPEIRAGLEKSWSDLKKPGAPL